MSRHETCKLIIRDRLLFYTQCFTNCLYLYGQTERLNFQCDGKIDKAIHYIKIVNLGKLFNMLLLILIEKCYRRTRPLKF